MINTLTETELQRLSHQISYITRSRRSRVEGTYVTGWAFQNPDVARLRVTTRGFFRTYQGSRLSRDPNNAVLLIAERVHTLPPATDRRVVVADLPTLARDVLYSIAHAFGQPLEWTCIDRTDRGIQYSSIDTGLRIRERGFVQQYRLLVQNT